MDNNKAAAVAGIARAAVGILVDKQLKTEVGRLFSAAVCLLLAAGAFAFGAYWSYVAAGLSDFARQFFVALFATLAVFVGATGVRTFFGWRKARRMYANLERGAATLRAAGRAAPGAPHDYVI